MPALSDFMPSPQEIINTFTRAATWWQIAILLGGAVTAFFIGRYLQNRLRPAIRPGTISGIPRTAMRTGVLVMIPLILWALLVLATAALRRWTDIPTAILHLAGLLVGALTVIRMGVFVLRHSFSPGGKLKAWERILTATIWSIVALHILGWLPAVIETLDEYGVTLGKTRISVYTVVSFILSIALLMLLALWFASLIHDRLMKSNALDVSMKVALSKLSKFVLLSLAVITAIISSGIDLTALALFGGALGVGIGFGMQRIVSNFLSGFVLIFEESIRPGDVIAVGGTYGRVVAMHARHVVVHTRDGVDILVPNESLLTSDIISWSYGDDRNIRIKLPVQISYTDDPEQVLGLLEQVARTHSRVLEQPPPAAYVIGFGDNGINLELRAWINDPEEGVGRVRSDLYRGMWRELKAAGVSIPFPQRDLHFTGAATESPHGTGNSGNPAESGYGQTPGPAENPAA
ncbi:MAG: mechanosensitive ion channel family protein [Acidiferrobacterales bacterium]